MINKIAKISLVGAGPGDPDLLTIKAVRVLGQADVVLYDALVNPEVLKYTPAGSLHIFVGKRQKKHRYRQGIINEMLVSYARTHGHVVRLKGGDPFIFGRGHEELEYARKEGIPVDIVPGLSSSTSLTALQQVPLTRRGINDSFWVLTGTTKEGRLSDDLRLAAESKATIVILMGRRKLEQICQLFKYLGKSALPAMVIQSGSRLEEKVVVGTVATITEKAENANIGTPAILVFGEVVAMHPDAVKTQIVAQKIGVEASV